MCTITYLPVNKKKFILTFNRDESPKRPLALFPQVKVLNDVKILCPVDTKANGTWIVTSDSGSAACLFNGAFTRHISFFNYRMSRGLVLLDAMKYKHISDFIKEYDFQDIEPFTLIYVSKIPDLLLSEVKWDGNKIHHKTLSNNNPHLWASVTLYTNEIIEERKQIFKKWLSVNPKYDKDKILKLHLKKSSRNNTSFLVNIEGIVQTVSVTSICSDEDKHSMVYIDLINNSTSRSSIYTKP